MASRIARASSVIIVGLIFSITAANGAEFACKPYGYWPKDLAAHWGIRAMSPDEMQAQRKLDRLRSEQLKAEESRCGNSILIIMGGDDEKGEKLANQRLCAKKVDEEFKPKREAVHANYNPISGLCNRGVLNGPIHAGDEHKFAFWLRKNPFITSLQLHSPGGDVRAAIVMGNELRKRFIRTSSALHGKEGEDGKRHDCRKGNRCCASACILVLLAGARYYTGNMGLHRPTSAEFASLSHDDVQSDLRNAIKIIDSYLASMGASPKIIQKMMSIPSSEILLLEFLEARQLVSGVPNKLLQSTELIPPSVHEWAIARCNRKRKNPDSSFCIKEEILREAIRRAKAQLDQRAR